jgi:hypothetical protein
MTPLPAHAKQVEAVHRRYTAFTSDSLASDTWTPVRAAMPPGASHGSILALTAEEYTQLEHLTDN